MTLKALRKDVCEANKNLEQFGLLIQGMGCASAIDRERGVVIAKPAAIPHVALTPEDMLVMDLAGAVVDGTLEPSPEMAAHLCLYRDFGGIGGVVNTSSPSATMFAQAERPIPCLGMIHASFFKGEIPVTRALRKPEIDRGYDRFLGNVIVERFVRLDATALQGVLVARHGPFAWGRTVVDALHRATALEQAARLAIGTLQLSPNIAPLAVMLSDKQYSGK